jgi:hypothetical protein
VRHDPVKRRQARDANYHRRREAAKGWSFFVRDDSGAIKFHALLKFAAVSPYTGLNTS